MVHITLALLAVLVSFAFFTLDEETLIILCSFIWVDAASGLLKKFLDFELLHKVDVIRSKFLWFLVVKRTFLLELISFHRSRLLASSGVVGKITLF
jgi:predicted membrane channel-forming protein YqfA (hemolysin III family)